MADYEVILDAELEPGAPITSSIGFRFRDNPVAIAQGAAGAPRVSSGALEPVEGSALQDHEASTTYVMGDATDTLANIHSSSSYQTAARIYSDRNGSLRVRFKHSSTESFSGSVFARVQRNGSTIQSWSQSASSSESTRSTEVSVSVGDVIEVQHRTDNDNNPTRVRGVLIGLVPGTALGLITF